MCSGVFMNWNKSRADSDLKSAMRKAWFHNILAWLRGEENDLLPFEAVKHLHPTGERYIGLQVISVDKIIGSVDRYRDFDDAFLPKAEHLSERWSNIRRLKLEGKELPPIQVYKVGETFFVKDGNHRVSVAHTDGQKFIDAEVIELDVAIPPEKGDEIKDFIIKGELAQFLEVTKLDSVHPNHLEIRFTTPGRYDMLLDHIAKRQYYMGLNLKRDIAFEEAVSSWYERLYTRMIEEIRSAHALDKFPLRTEADLYLWMMDHRYYLTELYGHDVGSRVAAQSFVQHYRPAWYKRLYTRLTGRRDEP